MATNKFKPNPKGQTVSTTETKPTTDSATTQADPQTPIQATAGANEDAGAGVTTPGDEASEKVLDVGSLENTAGVIEGTVTEPNATAATVQPDTVVVVDDADAQVGALIAMLDKAQASKSPTMAMLGRLMRKYIFVMGKSKPTDMQTVVENNVQLWLCLRATLNDTESFRDCMQFILRVFAANPDGAFDLNMLLRGIGTEASRLNADHRTGYTGLMTILSTAAGMKNFKGVSKAVDLARAMESPVFTEDGKQRVIGFFAS